MYYRKLTDGEAHHFVTRGHVDHYCECGDGTRIELDTQARSDLKAAEARATAAETALTVETARARQVATDRAGIRAADASVLAQLTQLELEPMLGTGAHHLSLAEATELGAVRATNPDGYGRLVAEARAKFARGERSRSGDASTRNDVSSTRSGDLGAQLFADLQRTAEARTH